MGDGARGSTQSLDYAKTSFGSMDAKVSSAPYAGRDSMKSAENIRSVSISSTGHRSKSDSTSGGKSKNLENLRSIIRDSEASRIKDAEESAASPEAPKRDSEPSKRSVSLPSTKPPLDQRRTSVMMSSDEMRLSIRSNKKSKGGDLDELEQEMRKEEERKLRKSVVGGPSRLKSVEEIKAAARKSRIGPARLSSSSVPSRRGSSFAQFMKTVRPSVKETLGFSRDSLADSVQPDIQQFKPYQQRARHSTPGAIERQRRIQKLAKEALKKKEKKTPIEEKPESELGGREGYFDEYGYREEISTIRHWRPSTHEDLSDIIKLFRMPYTRVMFGPVDIDYQMETAHTALSEINEGGRVVGHVVFYEYPNVPVVPSFAWLEWIHNLYGIEFCTERNTLFVHLLVWDVKYSHVMLLPMLETIFLNNVYVRQIILILPPLVALPDVLAEYFTIENPLDHARSEAQMNTMQRVAICMRHYIVPRFRMRKAVQSDNDDLVPIFNKISKRFRRRYGRYYIAEFISFPTEGRQCIVAELAQKAVGMMCLNDNIDLEKLNDMFDLAPFNGLHKWHEYDYVPHLDSGSEDSRDHLRVIPDQNDVLGMYMSAPAPGVLRTAAALKAEAHRQAKSVKGLDRPTSRTGSRRRSHSSSSSGSSGAGGSSSGSSDEYSSSSSEVDLFLEEIEEASMVKDRFVDELDDDLEKHESSIDFPYSEIMAHHRNTIVDMAAADVGSPPWGRMKRMVTTEKGDGTEQIQCEFNGPPNAFAIELFGLHEDVDERKAFDFLEAAFDCFPNLDYAILTMAPRFPAFPLLQHFVRITPNRSRSFPHELFVVHRLSVFGNMRVRHMERVDLSNVRVLVRGLPADEDLLAEAVASVARPDSQFRSFVLTAEGIIVGVGIIKPVHDLAYLRSHYDVEALVELSLHKDGSHGLMRHFFLTPAFQPHARFFLREIHRLSDATCIYHCQVKCVKKESRRVVGATGSMLPVAPRRGIQYQLDLIDPENQPCCEVTRHDEPFALYLMNRRYVAMPRRICTSRIVVVGASDTGISFLETLVLGPVSAYLTFHNLTLICQYGLPDENPDASPCAMMVPFRGRYNASFLERMQLRTHVTLVYGFMVALNRRKKAVHLTAPNAAVPYDYLVLCCGEQFQRPLATKRAKRERQRWRCFRDRKRAVEDESTETPENVFLINSHMEACNSFAKLHKFIQDYTLEKPAPSGEGQMQSQPYSVIVYGHCIEAMAGIAALQTYNIPNKSIIFVEPFPTEPAISFFNDAEVDEAVMAHLVDDGVTIYTSYTFNDWRLDDSRKKVIQVTFESRTEMLTLDCIALYCYDGKNVATRTFLALNRASLVYDGHLVINNHFRTNDPNILAAGPMTKYSRLYYADRQRHGYYNSIEIGATLARELLRELDPEAEHILGRKTTWETPFRLPCRDKDIFYKLPKFVRPIVTFCSLPGGFNYLYVTAPGQPQPLEVAMCQDSYGQVLVTGDCKSDQGYFRLHFNSNNFIETITCYTRGDFAVENIIHLYGKHERLLNNIMERFELGYILDFFEYFEEPWACALFHDRFRWLQISMLEYLHAIPLFGTATVMRELTRIMSKTRDKRVVEQIMTSVEQLYTGSKVEKLIAYELLRFIHHNSDMLTMYAHPMKIREVLQDSDFSPFLQEPWRYI